MEIDDEKYVTRNRVARAILQNFKVATLTCGGCQMHDPEDILRALEENLSYQNVAITIFPSEQRICIQNQPPSNTDDWDTWKTRFLDQGVYFNTATIHIRRPFRH